MQSKIFPISSFSPTIQEMCRLPYSFFTNAEPINYFNRFSFTDAEIPALLEIAAYLGEDDTFLTDCIDAPVHAWLALAQFDGVKVAHHILKLLNRLDWDKVDYQGWFWHLMSGITARSFAKARGTGDEQFDVMPLFLKALQEKERHETTRRVILDALLNSVREYPKHETALQQVLFDDLKELRIDCRDWYADCVCELAFVENPTPELRELINTVCRGGYAETYRYWENGGLEETFGFDFNNDPELLSLHKKSNETYNILKAFKNCDCTFPKKAVLKARELRDWIIPNLIEEVRNATAYARFGVDNQSGVVQFAVHLLGEFQAKESLSAVCDSLSLTEDQCWDFLYGDGLFESMSGILYRLTGDDLPFYDQRLRDANTTPVLRCRLLDALPYLVKNGALSEERFFDLLGEYLRIAIDEGRERYEHFVTGLVNGITASADMQFEPLVREAFDKELVNTAMISWEGAEADLHGVERFGPVSFERRLMPRKDFSDTIKALGSWAWFHPEPKYLPLPPPKQSVPSPSRAEYFEESRPAIEPIRNESPKVGRNDPCPCGSGKKFKKCCLKN